jgi:hypothetical protein
MTIGAALLLIMAGAILRFAVATAATHGIDLHTIGDILMIVGVLGLVLWLVVWAPWTRSRRPAARQAPPPDGYRQVPPDAGHRDAGYRQAAPPDAPTREMYREERYEDPYSR